MQEQNLKIHYRHGKYNFTESELQEMREAIPARIHMETAHEYVFRQMQDFLQGKIGAAITSQLLSEIQTEARRHLSDYQQRFVGADQSLTASVSYDPEFNVIITII